MLAQLGAEEEAYISNQKEFHFIKNISWFFFLLKLIDLSQDTSSMKAISKWCCVVNSLCPSDTIWQHRYGSDISSGYGLLHDGTKPLHEPMLTTHHRKCPISLSLIWVWKVSIQENHSISHDINVLTHWGRVTHICVGKLTTIGSDNGLSPGRRQAITWTNAEISLFGPLGTNFSEILTGIQTFSFKKMHLKMASAKWRAFCLGLNMLIQWIIN